MKVVVVVCREQSNAKTSYVCRRHPLVNTLGHTSAGRQISDPVERSVCKDFMSRSRSVNVIMSKGRFVNIIMSKGRSVRGPGRTYSVSVFELIVFLGRRYSFFGIKKRAARRQPGG